MRCCVQLQRWPAQHQCRTVISERDIWSNKEAWGGNTREGPGSHLPQQLRNVERERTLVPPASPWRWACSFTSTRRIWLVQTRSQQQTGGREGFCHPLLTGVSFIRVSPVSQFDRSPRLLRPFSPMELITAIKLSRAASTFHFAPLCAHQEVNLSCNNTHLARLKTRKVH